MSKQNWHLSCPFMVLVSQGHKVLLWPLWGYDALKKHSSFELYFLPLVRFSLLMKTAPLGTRTQNLMSVSTAMLLFGQITIYKDMSSFTQVSGVMCFGNNCHIKEQNVEQKCMIFLQVKSLFSAISVTCALFRSTCFRDMRRSTQVSRKGLKPLYQWKKRSDI